MKIALMCGSSLDEFQQQALAPILEDRTIEVVEALIDCRPKPSAKKRFLKNLKRGRGGYMLVMLFKSGYTDYDNAVLYNDSIVDQICRRFEEQNAVVVYVPDHGEEVYEPGRSIICRNHTDDIDAELAYHEYEIPFWVWCSKSYIAAHPDLFQRICAAKDRRLMIDALPHMLMYLAGIHSKDYNEAYDILSDGYDEQRPRLLKGKVDYDKVIQLINNKGTR